MQKPDLHVPSLFPCVGIFCGDGSSGGLYVDASLDSGVLCGDESSVPDVVYGGKSLVSGVW